MEFCAVYTELGRRVFRHSAGQLHFEERVHMYFAAIGGGFRKDFILYLLDLLANIKAIGSLHVSKTAEMSAK